jgi:hypothetical protein
LLPYPTGGLAHWIVRQTNKKMKVSHQMISIFAIFGLICSLLVWLVIGDPISQSKWNRINEGMTKTQVLEILGEPDSLDGNQLQYSRFLNAGWVEFMFDDSNLLIEKNDESVLGSLR